MLRKEKRKMIQKITLFTIIKENIFLYIATPVENYWKSGEEL